MNIDVWGNGAWVPTRLLCVVHLGVFVFNKFKSQCRHVGVYAAARNLRKQGVPLDLALAMLRAAMKGE